MAAESSYLAIAVAYAEQAAKDRGKKFGRHMRLAAKRFLKDLDRARDPGCPFEMSEWHVDDVCSFIELLPHVEGQWSTTTIGLEPWQVFILANVFGFRRRSNGARRFNTAYIEVARKNAKSTLSSGIALYCLSEEGETGPQVKTAATTGDQARIVFDVASKMASASTQYLEARGVEVWKNAVTCAETGGNMKPINAKASTQDGLNPHLTIIDELHAHKDRKLFDVLRSAQGARSNPLSWYITTAGYDLQTVCYEQRTLAAKILEGAVEADHYFAAIFSLDPDDDWRLERNWIKANPNYGVSIFPDKLREEVLEAKESPESEAEFKTKRCNIWLNSAATWLSLDAWDAAADPKITLDDLKGHRVALACDMSNRDDMTAIVAVAEIDGEVRIVPRFYLPRDVIQERVIKGLGFYRTWVDAGVVTATDGDWIDAARIEEDIRAIADDLDPVQITFDTFGAGPDIASRLDADGYPASIRQYTAKNVGAAALELEARVRRRSRLRHDGNPCLRWHASNAVVERRVDGSILPKKESPMSMNKIDGIAATVMAMSHLRLGEEERPRVINYERGSLAL